MFQIKTFLGILASMVNRLRLTSTTLTDFNVGSNIRVLLEAFSQEVDELYQQMVAALQAAILQATYISFGFTPLPAVSATGTIRVTITSQSTPTIIGLGTIFTPVNAGGVTYSATAQVTIPAGNTFIDVPVVASLAGVAGNLAANSQFSMGPSAAGFISASNLVAFTNGLDTETPTAQYVRFQTFIKSLARSTLYGIAYGASSVFLTDAFGNVTERVAAVQVFEPYSVDTTQPAWLFRVYVFNGVSGASAQLLAQVLSTLYGGYDSSGNPVDGYKAAGTAVQVLAVTMNAVAITAALTLTSTTVSATAIAAVETAWATYLNALPTGGGAILGKLEALAFGVAGVVDCQISTPTANIAGAVGVQIVAGAFTVTSTGGL